MKLRYVAQNNRVIFEAEPANVKEAFEFLSTVQELFEEAECGLCGQSSLSYEVREFDGNHYYKLVCRDCGATLDFGQRRDGINLFIKRKDADGRALPNRGWYRYQGQAERTGPPQRPSVKEQQAAKAARQESPRATREENDPVPF